MFIVKKKIDSNQRCDSNSLMVGEHHEHSSQPPLGGTAKADVKTSAVQIK